MRKQDILAMAHKNLWRRKARTILTCLGVIIGTAAIVVMLSLGIGLKLSMEQSMAQWGSLNIIRIHPGASYDEQGEPRGDAKRLHQETVEELKNLPGVVAVSPAYEIHGEARLGRKQGWLNLVGLDLAALEELELITDHGRLPTPEERFTIVAGAQVIGNFWDERAPRGAYDPHQPPPEPDPAELLNQRVSMLVMNQHNPEKRKNFNLMVVGILEETNMEHAWQVYGSLDDVKQMRDFMHQGTKNRDQGQPGQIIHEKRVGAISSVGVGSTSSSRRKDDTSNDFDYLLVRVEDLAHTKLLSAELREQGFNAYSMADNLKEIERVSKIIQAVLGGIGGITLLVAALGIANSMVMSIYERTREIGIIKVIGASFADVRALFLTEAALIGFIGGLLGLVLSYLASLVINILAAGYLQQGMALGNETAAKISVIPPWLALFAVGFAMFIGLAAGFFPANRAVKLSPIVAIRNE
ncbi:MAG: ABC transporter permease [Firmicutes bacterium]|nr:ABC transporter permease [Bacillota bacterium]